MPKQTKSSNNTALKGFALTLVILILAVCVMAAMTEGFSNWNPYGWFDKPAEEQQTPEGDDPAPEEPTEEPGGMVTDVQNSSLMTLSAVAATTAAEGAESSTTITATVKPDTASDKSVVWSISFSNPSSSWANGKNVTDYVNYTTSGEGAITATVNCLQPFGEQIILTATANANPEATASVTIDYVKRVVSYDFTARYNGSTFGDQSITNSFSEADENIIFDLPVPKIQGYSDNFMGGWSSSIDYEFGEGTITPTLSSNKIEIKYSEELINIAQENGYEIEKGWELVTSNISVFSPYSLFTLRRDGMMYLFAPSSGDSFNDLMTMLAHANGNLGELKISFTYSASEKTITTEFTANISFTEDDMGLIAKNVETTVPSIVF